MTDDDLDQPMDERPLVRIDFPAGEGPLAAVALLTLDRPEAHNALSFGLVAELGGPCSRSSTRTRPAGRS